MWPFSNSLTGRSAADIPGNDWFNQSVFSEMAQERIKAGKPLRIQKDLRGHVVLLHFWDFTSVNCINELPHMKTWWQRYNAFQFVVIGIHTPKYSYEGDSEKVSSALLRFGLPYPIINDADYEIWQRYGSDTWPRKLLINHKGKVIFDYSGTGGEMALEAKIQGALKATHPDATFAEPIKPV
ncbi:MAG: redoxin domain-containing protein [Candidatus Andersenbacteria bacterium]